MEPGKERDKDLFIILYYFTLESGITIIKLQFSKCVQKSSVGSQKSVQGGPNYLTAPIIYLYKVGFSS